MLLLLDTYYYFYSTNKPRKIIWTDFSFFLFSLLPFFADRCETTPARHPLCRTCTKLFWLSFGTNARSAPRSWQGRPVGEQRPWMPEILILIFLLLLIIIIIIFAINKQCNHNFCTQQHCWYHMAYILYYWIRAYTLTVSYLLLHIYTLRFNTSSVIVYDVNFFRTHCEIIIEFSFESIILLPTAIL